jgi:hypothetical protein
MQGRQDQSQTRDAQKRAIAKPRAALHSNDTGKSRSIPQRPSTMARLDQPPATPRVARPQRGNARPPSCRKRILTLSIVAIVCIVLAFFLGYAAINFFAATNASADAARTAADFLNSIAHHNYDQAYNDLGPAITIPLAQDDFKQQAQADDRCYGTVNNYSEVANSAVQNNAQSYTFDYLVSRSKLAHPYTLRLVLQQDTTTGHWQISSYGANNDLVPGQSSCS